MGYIQSKATFAVRPLKVAGPAEDDRSDFSFFFWFVNESVPGVHSTDPAKTEQFGRIKPVAVVA